MVFIYSYYANYDDCGTAVAAFENTFKWPVILKFSHHDDGLHASVIYLKS